MALVAHTVVCVAMDIQGEYSEGREMKRYDVIDQNGDILESTELFWVASRIEREYNTGNPKDSQAYTRDNLCDCEPGHCTRIPDHVV
jgi:hypothetical protein